MSFEPTDCILIMGQRGCGKSYLAKRLQAMWPRRVIVDSLNEYGADEGEVVSVFDDFANRLQALKQNETQAFVLIFQSHPENQIGNIEFEQILRLCFYFGGIQVVVEEVQNYSSPHNLPDWLKKCLLIGRHQNISLLFTSQRPGEVNKTIISQCAHIFCGKIIEGNDLTYIAKILRQDADKLLNIQDRRFIYFSKSGVTEVSNEI